MRKPRKTVLERTQELAYAISRLQTAALDYARVPSSSDSTRWLVNAAFELVSKARAFAKQGAKDGDRC